MDALKKFKQYLNEEEIPYFSDFDKKIFQYAVDNIENVGEGTDGDEVAREIIAAGDIINTYWEGIQLISSYPGESGSGWSNALEYIYGRADDMGLGDDFISESIKSGRWDVLGNILLEYKIEELLVASEIIAQAISSNEPLTKEDIQDLEQELDLFIDN